MDNTKQLTHLSLCTGYGGIDIGLKRALRDLITVCYVEIEAFTVFNLAQKIEAGLMDLAPIWSNLKTFPWSDFRDRVDVLSGGFPCQPFSAAGRRGGDEDPRHLWPYIVRGIKELDRPPFVFLENVEGIISSKLRSDQWTDPEGTPVLLHVLRELERLGYKATAGVFSAREVGAPHQRKRVFILACRSNLSESGRAIVSTMLRATSGEGSAVDIASSASRESAREAIQQRWRTVGGTREGIQRERDAQDFDSTLTNTAYPAPRGEKQYTWEPPRVNQAESSVGRNTDGSARWMDYAQLCESVDNRTDELRMLGNGVVPATVERAFRILWSALSSAV